VYPFERFTEKAKKVLTLAQGEAEKAHHSHIGTEHLLLGLLREDEGLAAKVLANLGVEIDKVRVTLESVLGRNEQIIPTSRVKKVIEIAFEEAKRMNSPYVGTEHLLLALLIEGEGVAAHVLDDLGANLTKVRHELDSFLKEQGPEEGADTGVEGEVPMGTVRQPGRLEPFHREGGWLEPETVVSAPVRSALTLAEEEAIRDGRGGLGTEHLLLGLIRQGKGRAVEALAELGVNLARAREAAAGLSLGPAPVSAQRLAYDFDIVLAMSQAERLSRRAPVAMVQTEHLLLGICRVSGSGAARALATMGVGIEQVEEQLGTRELSEPQELLEGELHGEGHFVGTKPGFGTEAFFVNVAQTSKLQSDPDRGSHGRDTAPKLERKDLIFMLDAKKRDWRKHRASAGERATALEIGRKLEQQGLKVGEFARVSFGLTPKTYYRWSKSASRSEDPQ